MKTLYWSRKPGNFVHKYTGEEISAVVNGEKIYCGPKFQGSVREWYETLVETILDCTSGMKTPKIYVSAVILTILECTVLYKLNFNKNVSYNGKISNFEIYVDSRLPNNQIKIVEGADVHNVIVKDINIKESK